MTQNDSLTAYVASFVDELVRVGVTNVVISPGSRSTPMAILMAEHPNLNVYVNIDERSAAFFALGIAKAKKSAVAILCTSGTAAANYYPAIVEASISRVPLLVLTADRPHELRDVGAPQAIDQLHLFGKYAKWFVEMAIPEGSDEMLRYVRTVAARATGKALASPAGPVHLNFPFREPLLPNLKMDNLWNKGQCNQPSHVNVLIGDPKLEEVDIEYLYSIIGSNEKGLIICGEHYEGNFTDSVVKLAEVLQFPILADPLSQLRSGSHSKEYIIDCYDAFLRNHEFINEYKPGVVIRFGAMPISKALLLYLKSLTNYKQIVVDGDGGWREPTLTASEMVYCNEIDFCEAIVKKRTKGNHSSSQWLKTWLHINERTKTKIYKANMGETLVEGKVFNEILQLLPNDSTVFVGNSMPIRDLDTFFINNEKNIKVMANRGANGIDGVVSTALGVCTTSDSPLVLVIGDLSFYHDLNGLLAAKQHRISITIVLINNEGGGIFSFLPQAKEETHFETLFGTPIELDYKHVVKMYGGTFERILSWQTFQQAFENSINTTGLSVIEVPSNRAENVMIHRTLWNHVSQEISNFIANGEIE
ncbi:2-succinyl-5-enolpyruvyl-6-hydroxy-3-cyclohexene-1-carboxylic-acid synthase [Cytobacillus sp. S13-E01]|uniref:2-succinyl-5-enolpyruvyl-6-hydroxy-3- cyclohexene-1-carboxylic-acid synthase n=1 Tax=Cytobacillus sp. S13-E01 TaxID=3031326 RepID=UPI0023D7CCF3|nr:2-succinyl-5-enolpyruvyl-6-hydroxy-3-cyclohexene-1-carboxylic-acid synthase [Cytobacillus sp. S13-E01]MDF0728392.1 2-succinyl-5-enolpyruvyl-6-hydroxy-3-cyclohexene-1-carboxylic-acid synthase [Cytobacillus sp. S13-E01]